MLSGKLNPQNRVICDVLIIGGGPAGLSAAIYAGRAKLKTVVVDEDNLGGQATTTYHIANYPGTDGVIEGHRLMDNMREQALSFGVRIDEYRPPVKINLQGENKCFITEENDYCAKAVIIATGAKPRKLPAEGADRLQSRGVHYCATCDGPFYKDKQVIVVGGGNSALQEAVFLTKFVSGVTIVHQLEQFQASKTAQDEAFNHPRIKVIRNSEIVRVNGDNHVSSVTLKNLETGEETEMSTDAVFVFIGHEPKSEMFKGQLKLTEAGYITTDEEMRTDVPGVFCAGDVRDKSTRQVITAASDGAVAAIQAEKYLAQKFAPAR